MSQSWMKHKPDSVKIPPTTALFIEKQLFRFVKKSTPDVTDFLPCCIDPAKKHMRSSRQNNPAFHGTSFFNSRNAAEKKQGEMPQAFKNKLLASGNIDNSHGVAECNNNSGHVTVWFYENIHPIGFALV